jgi:hypothetical protein
MRLLVTIFLLLAGTAHASAASGPLPQYLRELDLPYHEGDWTLQCNSSRFCQIIGAPEASQDDVGVRAVVMINRGIARDARPVVRIGFVDRKGSKIVPPPNNDWRLLMLGLEKVSTPVRLLLGDPQANGAYRAPPEVAAQIVGALRDWPVTSIQDGGKKVASMPTGNLGRLLSKMEELQHPNSPRMTEAQNNEWLKEYHYAIFRSSVVDSSTMPESVLRSCDVGNHVNVPFGARIGPKHFIWIINCADGSKVFLQKEGEAPILSNVRENATTIRSHSYAVFDANSLLHIHLPAQDNAACGQRLKMGFNGEAFDLIEYRRLARCRDVPPEFWPILWSPTSWKYVDSLPQIEKSVPPKKVAATAATANAFDRELDTAR